MLNTKNYFLRQCFFLILCLGIFNLNASFNLAEAQEKEASAEKAAKDAAAAAADKAEAVSYTHLTLPTILLV